jgi:hypothetical protein
MVDSHGLGGKAGGATGSAGVHGGAGAAGTTTPTGLAGDLGTSGSTAGGAGGDTSGGAGANVAGSTGTAGDPGTAGASGGAGTTATAGTTGAAGGATDDAGAAGATSTVDAGAAGTTGAGGTAGATATGGAGGISATGGAGGTAGVAGTGGAGGKAGSGGGGSGVLTPYVAGCSDGTREGFLDVTKYPTRAACSGAWDEPGLDSNASRAPQCERRGGNTGQVPNGHNCSAADLCSVGWHVCDGAASLANVGCDDAIAPFADSRVFFATRQHTTGLTCSGFTTGINNVYGCGNFGGTPDKSCNPLNRLLRDTDCENNAPWSCQNGPLGNSVSELDDITKSSSLRGGVLCCRDQ